MRIGRINIEEGCAGTTLGAWYKERLGKTAVNYGCASSHDLVGDAEANFDLIMKDGKIYKNTFE